jgi:3-oxoacyl-[acyl-carrier-protein] synthase-1
MSSQALGPGGGRAGVAIVGVGARTPVGLTAFTSAAAAAAGVSRIVEHPFMVDGNGEPFNVAMDRTLDVLARVPRIAALASSAIDQAMNLWQGSSATPLPVYLALPELGPSFSEADARALAGGVARHVAARAAAVVHPIPRGNAAGALALWRAALAIRERQANVVLVVGADSHIDADVLEALDRAGRTLSSAHRWGFPPGEAAAALLVVDSPTARSLGVAALGQVLAVGLGEEQALLGTDDACVGLGLAQAMKLAIDGSDGEPIHDLDCDINGERYRSAEYAYAALRLRPGLIADASAFVTAADAWGDVGAASVPLLSILALWYGRRGRSRGSRAMIWAGSESGLRGAAIVQPPPMEPISR